MGERIHRWLAVGAASLLLIGFVGWRWLAGSDSRRAGALVPNPQLSQLIPYSKPLADSMRLAAAPGSGSTGDVAGILSELRRDPFANQPLPQVAQTRSAGDVPSQAPPRRDEESQWKVTATVTFGSRFGAIINDVLFYVGDSIPGGARLTSVEKDRVVLTDPKGAAHTIAVKEGEG